MKAGIITYWFSESNYGTVLQNYAVQTILKKNGYEPTNIRFSSNSTLSFKEKINASVKQYGILATIGGVLKRKFLAFSYKRNQKNDAQRSFKSFIDQYISNSEEVLKSSEQMKSLLPEKSLYVVGSDQIWNVDDMLCFYAEREIPYVFLENVPDASKKISFAASLGTTTSSSPYKEKIGTLLKRFDLITVREKNGIEICKSFGVEKVFHHFDPTLMLDRFDYRNLIHNESKLQKGKYILLYLLNDATSFSLSSFYKWAKNLGLQVVYVNGNTDRFKLNFYKKSYPSIPEWLELIDNAKFVFTNSFHGTVFSIIFNKQFLYINQKKYKGNNNPRLESLLNSLSITDRFYDGDFAKVCKEIDYKSINDYLESYRKTSQVVEFLKKNSECEKIQS